METPGLKLGPTPGRASAVNAVQCVEVYWNSAGYETVLADSVSSSRLCQSKSSAQNLHKPEKTLQAPQGGPVTEASLLRVTPPHQGNSSSF